MIEFIKEIQTDERYDSFDEPAIKQGIVLKALSFLDWDPFNMGEIQPEFEAEGERVDFALKNKNSPKAFLVVRKGIKALKNCQKPIIRQAEKDGVKLAVLTDGITWWFYLPHLDASLEDKRFETIDMNELKPADIARKFQDFLSKENVVSGKAVKAAESMVQARLRDTLIKESLPKAWNKIMEEPENWLFDILAKVTKELCGHEPDREAVEKFLSLEANAKADITAIIRPKKETEVKAPEPKESKREPVKAAKAPDYNSKSIVSFTFLGNKYSAKAWKDLLIKLCEIMANKHKEDFEMVLTLSGRNRDYFSVNPYELLNSEKIKGTDIYVDVDLNAMGIVALCHRMLELFGYKEKDLSIDMK
ncbi:MAG: restriction endonuclease subunit R [Deltaproteobacteria bacterium]|nr:restriction endonuclease subunit R [Deltaproteobacteria bacterium]MBW2138186.1 restriction endonuclease subunit R [Deltaproteobacteria bacterium]